MVTTALIAFREFLEAFLLIGVFIGLDRKLEMKKRREILIAAIFGLVISLVLPIFVFLSTSELKHTLTEKNADLLEGYCLVFSGFFLAYVVFSLHAFMKSFRDNTIAKAHEKMKNNLFDASLFFTILFFVAREGLEVALLIASTSLFSIFWMNILGLFIGFFASCLIGILAAFTYIRLPFKYIFMYTQYLIILVGAAMTKNGVMLLSENYNWHIDKLFSFNLIFLPDDQTILGHSIKNITGLQRNFGFIQLCIMLAYVFIIYHFFIKKSLVQKTTGQTS